MPALAAALEQVLGTAGQDIDTWLPKLEKDHTLLPSNNLGRAHKYVDKANSKTQEASNSGSTAEALHLDHFRLLGVRQATPNGAVLLERGERPLWVRWLVRAGRLWNRLLAEPQGSLLQRALAANLQLAAGGPADLPGQRPWAAQLPAAVGMPVDLQNRRCCVAQLRRAALGRHLQEGSAAAARPGTSKLARYLARAWAGRCRRQKSTPPLRQRT